MLKRTKIFACAAVLTALCAVITGCSQNAPSTSSTSSASSTSSTSKGSSLSLDGNIKQATEVTATANKEWYNLLDFSDKSERENAQKD